MRTHIRHAIPALASLSLLAGCGSEPEAPPEPAPVEEAVPVEEAPPPAPPPPPPVVAENVAEAPPPIEITPDVQVLDDADATGMTARVDRSEPSPEIPGETPIQ